MSILERVLGPSDFGLMTFTEIANQLREKNEGEDIGAAILEFIRKAFAARAIITGVRRDQNGRPNRAAIPAGIFEGTIVLDWVTCTDDDLWDLNTTSGVRFLSINGPDGDNIKIIGPTLAGPEHIEWTDIAVDRAAAEAVLAGEAWNASGSVGGSRPSIEAAKAAILKLWGSTKPPLPTKKIDEQINKWLAENHIIRTVSRRTIVAAFKDLAR